jgi:hypothetical protein
MEIIILFVGYIVFAHVAAAIMALLIELVPEFMSFLLECLWIVLKLLLRSALWLVVYTVMLAIWLVRGLRNALVLLFYLVDEWRRGPPEDDEDSTADENSDAEAEEECKASTYEDALKRLGLSPEITRDALKRAYRKAIRAAHPDAGGSARAAQEVNRAYEIVLQWNGWAR